MFIILFLHHYSCGIIPMSNPVESGVSNWDKESLLICTCYPLSAYIYSSGGMKMQVWIYPQEARDLCFLKKNTSDLLPLFILESQRCWRTARPSPSFCRVHLGDSGSVCSICPPKPHIFSEGLDSFSNIEMKLNSPSSRFLSHWLARPMADHGEWSALMNRCCLTCSARWISPGHCFPRKVICWKRHLSRKIQDTVHWEKFLWHFLLQSIYSWQSLLPHPPNLVSNFFFHILLENILHRFIYCYFLC